MAPLKFASALEASSYQSPGGGAIYATRRKKVVETALAMGYDATTMNSAYPRYVTVCNFRVFQSFEEQLKDKFQDLLNTRGIGVMAKSYTIDLKRPTKFPDSLIVANRLTEVLPDRYYGITTMRSLQQEAIVAEAKGYVVFFDYDKGVPANLIEAGGVHAELHSALLNRKEREEKIAMQWNKDHPKRPAKL